MPALPPARAPAALASATLDVRPTGSSPLVPLDRTSKLHRDRELVLGTVAACRGTAEIEWVPIMEAGGRWLAEPVFASRPAPPFTCSAMDGFAVLSSSVTPPARLRVCRAIYAGELPGEPVAAGEAARIYTGAPLPPGTDAVVREESAREADGTVDLRLPVRRGENVRLQGEDVPLGGRALDAGLGLGPRQLGLLCAVGAESVAAVRRPRVTVLSTGDEVVSGRTPDSNGVAVAAALRALGAAVSAEKVRDDLEALTVAVTRAVAGSDAVITIGGVSVGARDHVPEAVRRAGAEVRLHGVPMKPGKPFLFAMAGRTPIFGLPGSPSACLVAFEVFVRPAVLVLCGAADLFRKRLALPLAEPLSGRPGRSRFVWARVEPGGAVSPVGRDAAQVRGPALADALVWIREDEGDLPSGRLVETWLLGADGGCSP